MTNNNRTTVVAIASGKGGVGKTILTACLGTLASEDTPERKVLVADLDFGVKGLTFLYAAAEEWVRAPVAGSMLDVINDPQLSSFALDNARCFGAITIVPADVGFDRKIDWDTYLPGQAEIRAALKRFVECALLKGFQFIIFDTGAGINGVLLALVEYVDTVIVIIEPDEISLTSALDLRGELKEVLGKVRFVVNKSPDVVKKRHVGIELLDPVPLDSRFHAKFVRNARMLARGGFRGTRYKRYVGQIAKKVFSIRCGQPTFFDYIYSKAVPRFFVNFVGHVTAFLVLLFGVLAVAAWWNL